jgi:putative ABC transport system permease protein
MRFVLATLWFERRRFLPAGLAVAFSALLVALQCGLLVGTFSAVSLPVDRTRADLWIGGPNVACVDTNRPIPADRWRQRLGAEAVAVESYVQDFGYWRRPDGGTELVLVVGGRLAPDALGRIADLTPELCSRLAEPGAVVLDATAFDRLGVAAVGDRAEVNGRTVRVAGTVRGLKGLQGPYLFCSPRTARDLLNTPDDRASFLLVKLAHPEEASAVAARLEAAYPGQLSAWSAGDLSARSRRHWLTKTGGGIALLCAAALGLIVGAVITGQTLKAATAASVREFAVLRALGTPRRRIAAVVLGQSLLIGVLGTAAAIPLVYGLAEAVRWLNARAAVSPELMAGTAAITLGMSALAGLSALRTLRLSNPVLLLR